MDGLRWGILKEKLQGTRVVAGEVTAEASLFPRTGTSFQYYPHNLLTCSQGRWAANRMTLFSLSNMKESMYF